MKRRKRRRMKIHTQRARWRQKTQSCIRQSNIKWNECRKSWVSFFRVFECSFVAAVFLCCFVEVLSSHSDRMSNRRYVSCVFQWAAYSFSLFLAPFRPPALVCFSQTQFSISIIAIWIENAKQNTLNPYSCEGTMNVQTCENYARLIRLTQVQPNTRELSWKKTTKATTATTKIAFGTWARLHHFNENYSRIRTPNGLLFECDAVNYLWAATEREGLKKTHQRSEPSEGIENFYYKLNDLVEYVSERARERAYADEGRGVIPYV